MAAGPVIDGRAQGAARQADRLASRILILGLGMATLFAGVAVQMMRLGLNTQPTARLTLSEPIGRPVSRPDIIDRQGRLLASDVEMPSLYADPGLILDVDEVVERLIAVLPELDPEELRAMLADRSRRFAWIKRGVAPRTAQAIHDLGLPGLAFRREPRRAYPAGRLAGHVLGRVNPDNRGITGLERFIDEAVGGEAFLGSAATQRAPVYLSLDLGVQHSLEDELAQAIGRYRAAHATGLILDIETGEVLASAAVAARGSVEGARLDTTTAATYELGSIFKLMTVALALEQGTATLDKVFDVRAPLRAGPYQIRDLYPLGRPLAVRDIFLHSSNVGAGMMALEVGTERQKAFLTRLGLLGSLATEQGPVFAPQVPKTWGRAETITISYGHGLAVAPLQFAAAAASLLNGGHRVTPTYLRAVGPRRGGAERVVSPETSARLVGLMRRNVTTPSGTGRRADVPGFEVGGKTGTAEIAVGGGYNKKAVISSFLGIFPSRAPRYLTLVILHEPQASEETDGRITAGVNAAPAAGRIIARVAPLLGVLPARERSAAAFDGRPAGTY